jgi:lipopolysaccharide/colanic/teichoic acid biosynthesis glycosyltransferase
MTRRASDPIKRAIDLVGSAVALVILSPLLVLAAAAVRVSLGRPILFRQDRTGRDGRRFKVAKLRTMRPAAPGADGPEHDAERLTKVGRVLRTTSIDELPTLWKVMTGRMSLVGPRPLPIRYEDRYSAEHARRRVVRPGITGWTQIRGRNALTWEQKLDLDIWYVDNRSLRLDLKILIATIPAVIAQRGISQDGHATMPEFEGTRGPGS